MRSTLTASLLVSSGVRYTEYQFAFILSARRFGVSYVLPFLGAPPAGIAAVLAVGPDKVFSQHQPFKAGILFRFI